MSKSRRRSAALWASVAMFFWCAQAAMAATPRVVVELFTSLGCSSCPPADALVGSLSTDSAVLALSFHVNYWDNLGFPDPFSSKDSTDRQYAYAQAFRERSVFTPQLVINGTQSLVGSQAPAVQHAVEAANQTSFPVQASLTKQDNGGFALSLAGSANNADVWELRYVRKAVTQVRAGENGGRTLETYNNVTHIRRLGSFKPGTTSLPPLKSPDDGLAIVVQAPGTGRVLGAVAATSS